MQSKSYDEIAAVAREMLPQMAHWAELAPYEKKGILFSEILFMLAYMKGLTLNRILESGRARGQSTLLMSLALPETKIVSIEYNPNSPDVPVAAARLKNRKNVELLFGDARKVLPEIVRDGDIAIIDGPKGFRAVRLALALLASGKASHVFVHDLYIGTPERKFVDAHLPEARFSDHRAFATTGALADKNIQNELSPSQKLEAMKGDTGYGFSLACLPRQAGRNYTYLRLCAVLADLRSRIFQKPA